MSVTTFTQQWQWLQMYTEARRRLDQGDAMVALSICEEMSKAQPRDPNLLALKGEALALIGQTEPARAALAKAAQAMPDNPSLRCLQALTYRNEGRFAEARRLYDAALRIAPNDPGIVSAKAMCSFMAGEIDQAMNTLSPLMEQGVKHISIAVTFAMLCPKLGREREGIALLRECLMHDGVTAGYRVEALFHLGALHDRIGEYDRAFAAFEEANRARGVRFDPESFSLAVDEMIARWNPIRFKQLPRSSVKTDKPVFIVGLPRSGTSLVEQILASHPEVHGAGELTDVGRMVHDWQGAVGGAVAVLTDPEILMQKDLDREARSYLTMINRLSPRTKRVTDKMPLNFLHLGVISLLFPAAKVINCVRDPLDTCLSCFAHNFGGNNPFTYNLAHLGLFHRDYQRVMRHWHATLDIDIVDVSYEELVAEQEQVTRRMVEFISLPWNDTCLRFHENKRTVMTLSKDQVRRPMYGSSVGRHVRYEKHLAPLRAALGEPAKDKAA